MYIAVKDKDGIKVGYTIKPHVSLFNNDDYLLEDNLCVQKIKGQKGCYVFIHTLDRAGNLIKYNKKLFNFEINDKNMFCGFIARFSDFLKTHDLLDCNGKWHNCMLITNGESIYEIDNSLAVTKLNKITVNSDWCRLIMGYQAFLQDLDAESQIIELFRMLEKETKFFPITIFNTKTGKKKTVLK